MANISNLIQELVSYGISSGLVSSDDAIYTTNRLLEVLELQDYAPDANSMGDNSAAANGSTAVDSTANDCTRSLANILSDICDYAAEAELFTPDTVTMRDLFDTKLMGVLTPPPSVVRHTFGEYLKRSPEAATDYYYSFSKATNYIRTDRIAKDEKWVTTTDFGDLDITINLSKPEKDPRDIAAAGKAKKSGYPACLLCKENEGYAGHVSHPARQNHRVIPLTLGGEQYFLQYSPYVYYNEHCIIFNAEHTPMIINRKTFEKLFDFVTLYPHYTAGSNADLPIVGGSILSHDHFQGGHYEFAMVRAPYKEEFTIPGYEDIRAGIINWPLSTIRLSGSNKTRLAELADHILTLWRSYTDEEAFILAETDGTPHNTITPIARRRGDLYEIDLVLRNNITTDEHPLGVYHPHAQWHHIKKENIGLIEVMGLAVLPSRLKKEMSDLEDAIMSGTDICASESLIPHAPWAAEFLKRRGFEIEKTGEGDVITSLKVTKVPADVTADKLHDIVHDEVGVVFSHVLEDAGVYKMTEEGLAAFRRFIATI